MSDAQMISSLDAPPAYEVVMDGDQDEIFWGERLKIDYGYNNYLGILIVPIPYIKKYRHPERKWFDIYVRWREISNVHNLNNIANMKTMITLCTMCIAKNYNDICIWILEKYGIRDPNIYILFANICIIHNNDEVSQWLQSRGVLPDIRSIHKAINDNDMLTLRKLDSKGVLPDQESVTLAVEQGNMELVQWIASKGYIPSTKDANYMAEQGYINLLQWSESMGTLPDVNGANSAAEAGYIDILQWLASKGVLPNVDGANSAVQNIHGNVMRWLQSMSIRPNSIGADYAIVRRHFNTLLWIGVLPQAVFVNDALEDIMNDRRMDVLHWLRDMGHVFDKARIDQVIIIPIRNGDVNILEYFENMNYVSHIKQLHTYINIPIMNGDINMLQWFESKGVFPHRADAESALNHGHLHILQWLAKENLPDTYVPSNKRKKVFPHGNMTSNTQYTDDIKQWLREHGILGVSHHISICRKIFFRLFNGNIMYQVDFLSLTIVICVGVPVISC